MGDDNGVNARRPAAPRAPRRPEGAGGSGAAASRGSGSRGATGPGASGRGESGRGAGGRSAGGRSAPRPPVAGSRPAAGARQGGRPSTSRRPAAATTKDASPSSATDQHNPPRQITVRTLVLFLVILVAFIVLAPTLRAYISQQEEQRDILARTEAAEERSAELQRTIERWEDEAFVQAQARERLGFVMPGETSYRVVDPETITGEEVETDPEDGPVVVPQVGPWYLTVTDSIQVAGEVEP